MQVVHPVCCGLDVHQATLTACLRHASDDGQSTIELREFGTVYSELLALSDWLVAQHCPVVAMESTGVHWKPVYHVLVGVVEVLVGHAREMRPRPGKKTDKADARWIAALLAHGLIRPSFVPPPESRALRDLTRTRVGLVQTRTQAKNRVQKVLEDSNIKRTSVVSDVFGKSGRQMLKALLAGEPVVYLHGADNGSRLLPSRRRGVHQPVICFRIKVAGPRLPLVPCSQAYVPRSAPRVSLCPVPYST